MPSYEHSYLIVGSLVVVALVVASIPLLISAGLRPRKPSAIKLATYECGIESKGDSWIQFKSQYYLYALAFVIFDLETVFLIPCAVALDKVGFFAFLEMTVFVGVLLLGLVWEWSKGVLEWR
ncbi:MAG: NADH-quinone oxidoreductase subunit A [Verrucomicrobiae bacterium]|nr:NADH-quinone oxidoreductase subunit A [Verrucomicrobiae bacterium]